jgi:hypothetical protein
MLLHHALMDLIEPVASRDSSAPSKHERQQRFELLISRLVRCKQFWCNIWMDSHANHTLRHVVHWDRFHLVRVKSEYEEKYGRIVEEDVEEATKGDFREFCIALCQADR